MNTNEPPAPEPPFQVLWTGGWDSSYRVLHLAIVEQKNVAPLYFKSPWRKSTPDELAAMEKILAALTRKFPEARRRILPLAQFDMDKRQDRSDPFIVDHHALQKIAAMGPQYALIAREVHRLDLTGVEYGFCAIEKVDRLFAGRLEAFVHQGLKNHRLRPGGPDDCVSRIFGRFHFPHLSIEKSETIAEARKHGFLDLLELSWFCYAPRGGQPCGICYTCCCAVHEGFGWRLPLKSKLRRLLHRQQVARFNRRVNGLPPLPK